AVQVGHTQDPFPVDAGVPRAAETHVDTTASPTDPGPEESGPIGIRVVGVRGDRDDVMTGRAEVIDEDPPATLRRADLGVVVVTEQDDPHTGTASCAVRRFSHSGRIT